MNILLVTLDQFRGDCLSVAGHPVVQTPHLDRLALNGVRFARHYSQSAPCGPARASLYTGMYQFNHRVVANGTPLDSRFDNIAWAARRADYCPVLFGYTDQSVDPRVTTGPGDPRLQSYEGILPGFEVEVDVNLGSAPAWIAWLRACGYAVSNSARDALQSESERPAEHSMAAFLTNRFMAWLDRQNAPWFAHLSHLRPHSPFAAAGEFARLCDPEKVPDSIAPSQRRHRLHQSLLDSPHFAAPNDDGELRRIKAQYFGMIGEVDRQLGRVWSALESLGQWDDTLIVVTSDHGEYLGDHGLMQKGGYFEQSYHVPLIVRDPRKPHAHGRVVREFSENIDIFPTLCDAMTIAIPAQCDGSPLTPFLDGDVPPSWRDAAHWEFDWRAHSIRQEPRETPWDRQLESKNLSVLRDEDAAYVHFGNGTWLCFDLAADPTWRTPIVDSATVAKRAQAMLTWRAQHADRTMTGMLVEAGGIGRWPPMPAEWGIDRNRDR